MHLREEIKRVQSQLKSAIQNHQMIVFKLKDRPVSTELRVQMNNVQRHIVSLGERQKKLLQELRKTLEVNGGNIKLEKQVLFPFASHKPSPLSSALAMRAANFNVKKESIIKENYENDVQRSVTRNIKSVDIHAKVSNQKKKKVVSVNSSSKLTSQKNGLLALAPSPSRKESTPSSTPSSSPTHGRGSSRNSKYRSRKKENSCPPSSGSDESQDTFAHLPVDPEVRTKLQYMSGLGLITREALSELQSRRTERKRRSTANPQFLYGSNMDQAVKRKRPNYLFSSNSMVRDNSFENLTEESIKQSPNSVSSCAICSSSKGTLTICASCHDSFHWSCAFESPQPESGTVSKCVTCLKSTDSCIEQKAEKECVTLTTPVSKSL